MGRPKKKPDEYTMLEHRLLRELCAVQGLCKFVPPDPPNGTMGYVFFGEIKALRDRVIKIQNICESMLGMEQEEEELWNQRRM